MFEIDFKRDYATQLKKYDQKDIDLFDFGYATTVHKSQGSEWKKVVLFEQRNQYQNDQDYARWLYTAATRAKEKLFIIYNYWGQKMTVVNSGQQTNDLDELIEILKEEKSFEKAIEIQQSRKNKEKSNHEETVKT